MQNLFRLPTLSLKQWNHKTVKSCNLSLSISQFTWLMFTAAMFLALHLYLLLVTASTTFAQFVAPPTNLINTTRYMGIPVQYKVSLTRICEFDHNVKNKYKYFDVAENQQVST
jgi:hypothetical protein